MCDDYKKASTFSDFWTAYSHVFPQQTHPSVGKETGESVHIKSWNNTLEYFWAKDAVFFHKQIRGFIIFL